MVLKQVTFCGWPAWRLQQGAITLHVVPSVGGRLMGMAWQGVERVFVHPALAGRTADLSRPLAEQGLCVGWHFPLWGGGKTWLAPQAAWPEAAPHPDLDHGAWVVDEATCDAHGLVLALTSPVCRHTGLQLRRRLVWPAGEATWRIEHTVHHRGTQPLDVGLWDVLMLRQPAVVQVPTPEPTSVWAVPGLPTLATLQQQGVVTLVTLLTHQHGHTTVQCDRALEFKCGFAAPEGALQVRFPAAQGGGVYRRWSATPPEARWAHGGPVEVFNAAVQPYLEVESHSPQWRLVPGDQQCWVVHEQWLELPP